MKRPPLGQHFLRDPRVVQTILQAAELKSTDIALEIGPGKGVLTDFLAAQVKELVAVEFDRTLAPKLQQRFAAQPHVKIIHADFLKINLEDVIPAKAGIQDPGLDPGSPHNWRPGPPEVWRAGFRRGDNKIKVLGNLPYSITSPIFEKLLAWDGWETGVFLIQREVAERMRSGPGSKIYGVLSLAIQLFADVEAIAAVKPGAFTPPPRVHSAVIRLRRKASLPLPEADVPAFFDLVHAAFSHRRKTLANSLSLFADAPKKNVEAWLAERGVRASIRAESLGLEEYSRLAAPWAIFRREKN